MLGGVFGEWCLVVGGWWLVSYGPLRTELYVSGDGTQRRLATSHPSTTHLTLFSSLRRWWRLKRLRVGRRRGQRRLGGFFRRGQALFFLAPATHQQRC